MNVSVIFPESLQPFIENGGRCFGAWTNEKQIAAAALLVSSQTAEAEMCLLDLCVERAFRGQGIAHALLQKLSAALASEGKKALRVRCMGSMNQVTGIYDLLVSAGFLPCLLTGRFLNWQLMDWMDSPLAEQMKQTPVPVDHICDATALPGQMRETLVARNGDFDPKLSRFYVIEEKLAGAVYVRRVDEDTVIAYRTYLAKDVPFRKVYVPLMASLYQECRRVLSEDASISVLSSGLTEEQTLRRLFDEPDSEAFVQEYVRRVTENEPEIPIQLSVGGLGGNATDMEEQETGLTEAALFFGWLSGETEWKELSEADFTDVWALYTQDEPELECCLQQKEFLLPCRKVTDEPSLREELNAWLTLLRREPFPPQKELPFAAYQEQMQALAEQQGDSGEPVHMEKEQQTAPVAADRLKYFVFPADDGMLEQVLPDFLLRRKKEHIVLGAKDEAGRLYAYASFYKQPTPQKTLMLEYMFVSEGQRGQGIGTLLIRFAKEVFAQAGLRGITTKQAGEGEKLVRMHEYLKRLGFVPITLSARTVIYYLQDLCESRLMALTPEQRRHLPPVERIEDRDDFRVVEFAKECREHSFAFERSRYDTEFTRFYIEGGRIRGVIAMEQSTSNLLMMLDTYIAHDCKSKYVQPALLLAALDEAKRRMREDAMLILQLYDGWNLEALETLLGQGESSLRLCEYVMPFR